MSSKKITWDVEFGGGDAVKWRRWDVCLFRVRDSGCLMFNLGNYK